MPKLSICMPSNRKFEDSIRAIESVKSFIADTDIEFVVSDNSNDPKKQNYFVSNKSENIKYFKGPPEAAGNAINAVTQSLGDFVITVSDDDHIVNLGIEPFGSMKSIEPDVVGIRPGFVIFNPELGLLKTSSFGINSLEASPRIKEYFHKCQGMNSTLFSAWRRDVLLDIHRCFDIHPTRGEYADWATVVSLISTGRVINDKETALFYNNKNWFGDAKFISSQISRLFTNAGLPASAAKHISLFQAVDSFILVVRRTSPLEISEKFAAGNFVLMNYLSSYIKSAAENNSFSEEERGSIVTLSKSKGFYNIMAAVLMLLSSIEASLVEKYKRFYFEVVGAEWGTLPR